MKLWFGLGNIGNQYKNTLHNIGQFSILALLEKHSYTIKENKKLGYLEIEQSLFSNTKIYFPLTFMNLSGEAVISVIKKSNLSPDDIVIFHDEVEIPKGDIRYKISGSAKGHNGVRHITQTLNTDQFSRIRIGVGRPENPEIDLASYLLSKVDLSTILNKQKLITVLQDNHLI